MNNFDVKCCYCDEYFCLVEDDNYPNELFDDGEHVERDCPECGKKLSIQVNASWSYSVDDFESDFINED